MHEPVIDGDEVRPTHIEVDLDAIAANYDTVRTWVGRPVMPILKANAYGHGLVPVARKLAAAGAPVFGVAYLEEAVQLRKAGITTRLLVLGGILGDQIPRFLDHELELTASSVDKLDAIQVQAAVQKALLTESASRYRRFAPEPSGSSGEAPESGSATKRRRPIKMRSASFEPVRGHIFRADGSFLVLQDLLGDKELRAELEDTLSRLNARLESKRMRVVKMKKAQRGK